VTGLFLQLICAVALLKIPALKEIMAGFNEAVLLLQRATESGAAFVFGYLGGGPLPFEETQAGASFILAFRALPLIIVISALTSVLTYWRVLPMIVRGFAYVLERTMGVGGAVGLCAAANIFVGMVEAPLFIRPYVSMLTRSELFVVMCTGMATIAGTVLVLYASVLHEVVPDVAGHLLIASIISAPAAIMVAKLMVPESAPSGVSERPELPTFANGTMDALTRGTESGLKLFLNIVAMLLVLVALVQLVNSLLGLLPSFSGQAISLQRLLGFVMAPVVWLMGIPWSEASTAGALMGTKTVLNEFLAYLDMARLPADTLSERSRLIMTYALCGFANFGSLGIMIGGLATMVPERRGEIVGLGLKSIIGGTLATSCTAAVIGLFW